MTLRILAAILLALVIVAVLPVAAERRALVPYSDAVPFDVLVIEHSPIGVIERTGHVVFWQATGQSMRLEYVADGDGDAIFHNGFEEIATCP